MLFEQIKRSQPNPDEEIPSSFEFMNRFDWHGSRSLRTALESWFDRYPEEHRKPLRSEFRSKDNKKHDGALFELACHELLRRKGFEPEIHPGVPGSGKRPDFLGFGKR